MVLAAITEAAGMAVSALMASLTGAPMWWRDLAGAEWRDVLAPVLRMAPMLAGLVIAVPAFRILASLGWPRRCAWRPLFWGVAGFMLTAFAAGAAMLNDYVTPGEMSVILIVVLLTAGFAVTVWSQRRAARMAGAGLAPVFE